MARCRAEAAFAAAAVFVLTILCGSAAGAQAGRDGGDGTRYFPVGHPVYHYLDCLQERGCLQSLPVSLRPYTRLQVLEALEAQQTENLAAFEKEWLERVRSECELDLGEGAEGDSTSLRVLTRWEASLRLDNLGPDKKLGAVGAGFGGRFGRVVFDSRFVRDPSLFRLADSTSHRDPLVAMPQEEGLIRPQEGYLKADFRMRGGAFSTELFFGRLARNWSPSLDGSLILGSGASSFDHLALTLRSRHFVLTHLVAQLDGMSYRVSVSGEQVRARRYFSAHRLDVRVRDNLRFGITETAVYGGRDRGFDPALMNPLTSFRLVGITSNDDHANNTLMALDGIYVAGGRLTIFGQFLADDLLRSSEYQDRWAVDLGARWRDLPGLGRSTASLRATVVSSFAYNTFQPFERYLFYGRPLGAPLGNDYWRVESALRFFPAASLDLRGHLSWLERGAQRVAGSLEAFRNSTVLAFPSPVVQRSLEAGLAARWQPCRAAHIEAEAGILEEKNLNNHPGQNRTRGYARLELSVYGDIPLEF